MCDLKNQVYAKLKSNTQETNNVDNNCNSHYQNEEIYSKHPNERVNVSKYYSTTKNKISIDNSKYKGPQRV